MSSFVCMWWSRCTDCYQQQWDQPFSKSKQPRKRQKKLLCQTLFLCWHISQSSARKSILYFLYLQLRQSRSTFICSFFLVFSSSNEHFFSILEWNAMSSCLCCPYRDLFVLGIWIRVDDLFLHIRMTCTFNSIGNIEILVDSLFVCSFIRPVCQTDTDPNSNEIEPAHIDNGRRNSLADRTKTEKPSPDDVAIIQIIYGFKWLRSISIKIKKSKKLLIIEGCAGNSLCS